MSLTQIERTVERTLHRGEQPTVEEWIDYLRIGDNVVKVPPKTENYAAPYYVWWEDGQIAVARGETSVTYHETDEGYVRQMLGYYNPRQIDWEDTPL